jgi:hypothetical protein
MKMNGNPLRGIRSGLLDLGPGVGVVRISGTPKEVEAPKPITIRYSQTRDGATFAIALLERDQFPRSRSRVFVAESGGFEALGVEDLRAVTKILTGVFERETPAVFVKV